jgi:hypothetical protein
MSAKADMLSQLEDMSVRLSVLEGMCRHLSNAHERLLDSDNNGGLATAHTGRGWRC